MTLCEVMTLEDAIAWARKLAEEDSEAADGYHQIAEWLEELKRLRADGDQDECTLKEP